MTLPCLNVDVLVVATIRRWVAEEFAAAAGRANIPLVHSWGFDVPDLTGFCRPAWWTPTEHAARLRCSGVPMPLVTPGPAWLARVPCELTGREIWAGRLGDIAAAPVAGFAKPAEMKVEMLPAGWWDSTAAFAEAAAAAGLGADSWVQVSPVRLGLREEYRCFVRHGRVVTASPYLLGDGTTYFDGIEDRSGLDTDAACRFAQQVADRMGGDQPPAYVLDVGASAGGWVVVEANPAWSSAAYGCDMDAVLATVAAACDHDDAAAQWRWEPDPWLACRAERMRPLPPA